MHRSLAAALIFLMGAMTARGTNVYYPDQSALSPDGKLRLDAKSPDNEESDDRPFASQFVYTLTEVTTGKVRWRRNQKQDTEGSCGMMFLNDGGWSVIFTGRHQLITINPEGRETGGIALLEEGFSDRDREHVSYTTAGPMWTGYSLWYFIGDRAAPRFVIRTWWDQRFVVDLTKGKLIKRMLGIRRECERYERHHVLNTLENNREAAISDDGGVSYLPTTAILLAGKLKLKEATPLLRDYEKSNHSYSSTSSSWFEDFEDGTVFPGNYSTYSIRRIAALSLRRLGERPKPLPAFEFEVRYKDSDRDHPFEIPPQDGNRHLRADQVKVGMSPVQVLELLGSPDDCSSGWEYDMDSKPSFTLVLRWKDLQVSGVERVSPARWKRGLERDESIAR